MPKTGRRSDENSDSQIVPSSTSPAGPAVISPATPQVAVPEPEPAPAPKSVEEESVFKRKIYEIHSDLLRSNIICVVCGSPYDEWSREASIMTTEQEKAIKDVFEIKDDTKVTPGGRIFSSLAPKRQGQFLLRLFLEVYNFGLKKDNSYVGRLLSDDSLRTEMFDRVFTEVHKQEGVAERLIDCFKDKLERMHSSLCALGLVVVMTGSDYDYEGDGSNARSMSEQQKHDLTKMFGIGDYTKIGEINSTDPANRAKTVVFADLSALEEERFLLQLFVKVYNNKGDNTFINQILGDVRNRTEIFGEIWEDVHRRSVVEAGEAQQSQQVVAGWYDGHGNMDVDSGRSSPIWISG